jgi:hypothetical protein
MFYIRFYNIANIDVKIKIIKLVMLSNRVWDKFTIYAGYNIFVRIEFIINIVGEMDNSKDNIIWIDILWCEFISIFVDNSDK